jgi:hypothetical protein
MSDVTDFAQTPTDFTQFDWKAMQQCLTLRRTLQHRLRKLLQPPPELLAFANAVEDFHFVLSRGDAREEIRLRDAILANEKRYNLLKQRMNLRYDVSNTAHREPAAVSDLSLVPS